MCYLSRIGFPCTVLLLLSTAVAQDTTQDPARRDQAIAQVPIDFAAAWQRHDAAAMAALFTDDGTLLNPLGRFAEGRQQVEQLLREEHEQVLREATWEPEVTNVQMVGRDVAVLDGIATIEGIQTPEGERIPKQKHRFTLVLLGRHDGRWLIAAGRTGELVPADEGDQQQPQAR